MSVQEIQQMPRQEKLRLMETLWTELSRDDSEFESPAWHGMALKETAQRVAEGREPALDWEQAKIRFYQPAALQEK